MARLLIIDDDATVRATLREILSVQGYIVDCAVNGIEGVQLFRQHNPKVTITDIIMPKREGIETITQIRACSPTAQIVAISGGARLNTVNFLAVARQFGANAVLAKPFEPEELIEVVRKCLAA